MAPVASVIRTLMAVPCAKLTVQVYELPVTLSAMVAKAGAEVWPWGMAALFVSLDLDRGSGLFQPESEWRLRSHSRRGSGKGRK